MEGPVFPGRTEVRENKSQNLIFRKVVHKNRVNLHITTFEATMSLDLPLVSLVLYLQEGEVNPGGDEGRVTRFEKKMLDWRRDVVGGSKNEERDVVGHVPSRKRRRRVLVRGSEVSLCEDPLGTS